jgi:hypothetical protein
VFFPQTNERVEHPVSLMLSVASSVVTRQRTLRPNLLPSKNKEKKVVEIFLLLTKNAGKFTYFSMDEKNADRESV